MIEEFDVIKMENGDEINIAYPPREMEIVIKNFSDDPLQLLKMINELYKQGDMMKNDTEIEIIIQGDGNESRVLVKEIFGQEMKDFETSMQGKDGRLDIDIIVMTGENENLELEDIINKIISAETLFREEMQNGGLLPSIQVIVLENNNEAIQIEEVKIEEIVEEAEGDEEMHVDGQGSDPYIVLQVDDEDSSELSSDATSLGKVDKDNGSLYDADGPSDDSTDDSTSLDTIVDIDPDQSSHAFPPKFNFACFPSAPVAQNDVASIYDVDENMVQDVAPTNDCTRTVRENFQGNFYSDVSNVLCDRVGTTNHMVNTKCFIIFVIMVLLILLILPLILFWE